MHEWLWKSKKSKDKYGQCEKSKDNLGSKDNAKLIKTLPFIKRQRFKVFCWY